MELPLPKPIQPLVIRDSIILPIQMGKVLKKDFREAFGCTRHSQYWKVIKTMNEKVDGFKKKYEPYIKGEYISEEVALLIINHYLPYHKVEIKIKG